MHACNAHVARIAFPSVPSPLPRPPASPPSSFRRCSPAPLASLAAGFPQCCRLLAAMWRVARVAREAAACACPLPSPLPSPGAFASPPLLRAPDRSSVAMAHPPADCTARLRCSFKSATFVLCTSNILVALFLLHAALSPGYYVLSSSPAPVALDASPHGLEGVIVQTKSTQELERIEDSNRMRRELLPVHLIERVREIQEETELEISRTAALNFARQQVALELANRLRELKLSNGQATQKALEEWKKRKLEKSNDIASATGGEEKRVDAKVQVLGEDTPKDLKQSDGESMQNVDMEHEFIPGRAISSECHAEVHTDYGGVAVRWGLTHHVNSAADCCQACLEQAKNASEGERKCNIWVYCPREGGCHSPDKYTHENHECWLKQAEEPQINFKGHYDEEYRQQHATAPAIVPWVAGVVQVGVA